MKRMIDDGMLDTAAKSFIKHYEGANAPADAPSSENSYFTSIKVAKAKAGARIAKLNIEIAGEKENMKKTYLEMGKLYYDTHKDSPEGFFIQLCEEIALAEQNIAEKEAEIEALKAEDDGSIEVEFEEIVDEEEPAAEEKCECSCKEKLEDAIETVEDMVEEVIDTVEDKVEEIVED